MAMLSEGERILPEGTLVHIQGVPVTLQNAAKFRTHPNNWPIIDEFSAQAALGPDDSSSEG